MKRLMIVLLATAGCFLGVSAGTVNPEPASKYSIMDTLGGAVSGLVEEFLGISNARAEDTARRI